MSHRSFPNSQWGAARRLRSSISEAEKRLWYHLRAHRVLGARFRRQALIGPYIVELIIELDGGQHGTARGMRRDQKRTDWLATKGYTVLRFWNSDVLENTDGVLDVIAAEIQKPPSLLAAARRADLPHEGGGEHAAR